MVKRDAIWWVWIVSLLGCSGTEVTAGDAALALGGHDGALLSDAGPSSTRDGATARVDTGAGFAGDSGSFTDWEAGRPGACTRAIPVHGVEVDVSNPTTVVGTGTPGSCTFQALSQAVSGGGIITFDCGPDLVTIPIQRALELPLDRDTVIDGGRRVTLDGGGMTRVLQFDSPNFLALDTWVTLQHLRIINGFVAGSSSIPPAPEPCSQGFEQGEGGGVFVRDGNLAVIDCIFEMNRSAEIGPDVGGGAIRMLGSKHGIVIVGSTFRNNRASNGGAVGCLFAEMSVYDSVFENNIATGYGANYDDISLCNVMHLDQYQGGSGGNGGALYSDGAARNVTLCGDRITDNMAGDEAFGGGLFFTSNDFGGDLRIVDTVMSGNTGGFWTVAQSGEPSAGTAVGTNTRSLTISDSTLQGL